MRMTWTGIHRNLYSLLGLLLGEDSIPKRRKIILNSEGQTRYLVIEHMQPVEVEKKLPWFHRSGHQITSENTVLKARKMNPSWKSIFCSLLVRHPPDARGSHSVLGVKMKHQRLKARISILQKCPDISVLSILGRTAPFLKFYPYGLCCAQHIAY